MLREFVDKLLELGDIRTLFLGDLVYTKDNIHRMRKPEQEPVKAIQLCNLAGIVDYIERIPAEHKDHLLLVIKSPTLVSLMSEINPVNDNTQFEFATAKMEFENFHFGHWYDMESFIIELLGKFETTDDLSGMLEMLSSIANDRVIEMNDDKFTQKLQIKEGLSGKANVEVKNPVSLKPFRTFREVDQPESKFVLRYQNDKRGGGGIQGALFEGDGGRWQLDAIAKIKAYLVGKVTIPVIG